MSFACAFVLAAFGLLSQTAQARMLAATPDLASLCRANKPDAGAPAKSLDCLAPCLGAVGAPPPAKAHATPSMAAFSAVFPPVKLNAPVEAQDEAHRARGPPAPV